MLLLAVIWGSSFLLIKRALLVYTPFEVGALRIFVAGSVLFPFLWRGGQNLRWRERRVLLFVGLSGSMLPALLFPLAQARIDSATSGILNALTPLFMLLVGACFFALKLRRMAFFGIIFGLLGTALLLLVGKEGLSWEGYALFAVLATFFYALNLNIIRRYVGHVSALTIASHSLGYMAPISVLFLLFGGFLDTTLSHSWEDSWQALAYIVLLGVVGTALAFFIFNYMIKHYDIVFSSMVTYLMPIVAIFWGVWDGEYIDIWQYIGMGGIFLGVYLTRKTTPLGAQK